MPSNKGQVWLINLDTEVGHEQNGIHPAIVIGQTCANMVVVVPLTSQIRVADYSFTELINPSQQNGLNRLSVAMIFQIRAISNDRMVQQLGKINDQDIAKIDVLIKDLLRLG